MRKIVFIALLVIMHVSANAQTRKTVAILGDSYSTYEGFLTPDTNFVWYFKNEKDINRTDVTDVRQTWWWQLIEKGGYKLGVNNSFSGATICNTGYDGKDYSDRSFTHRLTNLGNPDIIYIFGGTNDSWANSPIGEYKYDGITKADLYNFRPAMAYLLKEALDHYPNVKIYFILNNELKDDITNSVIDICKHYGVPCIRLVNIDKKSGHPSVVGQKSIAEQVRHATK